MRRKSPPPSESLTALGLGLAFRMAVSVSGTISFSLFPAARDTNRRLDTNKNTNKMSGCRRSCQNKREQNFDYRLVFAAFQTCANICEHDVVPRGGIEPPTP